MYKRIPAITRSRYTSVGGAESCGPDQVWDPKYVFPGLPPGQCVTKPATTSSSSWSDGLLDILKGAGSGLVTAIKGQGTAAGQSAAYQQYLATQQYGTPGWVVPVAIGGVGILAAVLLMNRK